MAEGPAGSWREGPHFWEPKWPSCGSALQWAASPTLGQVLGCALVPKCPLPFGAVMCKSSSLFPVCHVFRHLWPGLCRFSALLILCSFFTGPGAEGSWASFLCRNWYWLSGQMLLCLIPRLSLNAVRKVLPRRKTLPQGFLNMMLPPSSLLFPEYELPEKF